MKLLVLDGNSILNRAFYGIRVLTTRDGQFTNGVYGFANILFKLLDETAPDAVAVAFDVHAPTFRHRRYDAYKAGRRPMPDELRPQVPLLKELLDALGYVRQEAEGWEADDILGTQARACAARGDTCIIATGDRDSLQLVGPSTTVLLAGTKAGRPETTVYNLEAIRETYGVEPRALIEVKALMGDSSDNIPGVAGVGEKTALALVQQYGTVESLYKNLPELEIRDSLRKKLEAGRESAALSRELAEIHTDAPVETEIEKLRPRARDREGLIRLLTRLEFYKLIERLGLSGPAPEPAVPAEGTEKQGEVRVAADAGAACARARGEGEAVFCLEGAGETGAFGPAALAFEDGVELLLPGETAGMDEALRALFADAAVKKRTHDLKAAYAACRAAGAELAAAGERAVFDTLLAGYVLDPLSSGYEPSRLCDAAGVPVPAPALPDGLPEKAGALARRAAAVRAVWGKLAAKIAQNGQEKLLYEVELPLCRVLADMEAEGFAVDAAGIQSFGEALGRKLESIERGIYDAVGYEFNLNSPKQLGEALFDKLGLPPKRKTKTGYSTDADVLESLRGYHPVVDGLLEYRQLSKLKSTYTDGLLKVIAPDGRIHSSFNQVETRTGRISSTEPNLQNIPVRSEVGRELRRFFVAKPGCVLVDADYSQIELRILAHIADDRAMRDAFNSHVDIHALTASQVFRVPLELVTPLMRSRAKAVNFGIVYGIGAFSLSQDIGVTVREADSYIKGYLETFSGVRAYMERVIREAHEKGYVETLLGRRRALPELSSGNRNTRNFGERVARNTPIQGTAADIIKIAMIRVHERLRRENLRARLILQVHDELIVEAPDDEAVQAMLILREEMEGAMPLSVKLEADVHCGATWFAAKG